MNIHEYQAKQLLAKFGVAVPNGKVAYTAPEAEAVAKYLGGPVWVVKAQIHAGGRGKGGGVKVVKSVEDVRDTANQMLGMQLVTHQTGPQGREVKRVYVEQGCDIARELYLSFLIDRATSRITAMASTEGGKRWRLKRRKKSSKFPSTPLPACSRFTPVSWHSV